MKTEPKYVSVKNEILEKIKNGVLNPQDKLLSEDEYAELYGVSNITIRKALTCLVEEGYVHRIKGKGSFVRTPDAEGTASRLIAIILSAEDYQDISYMQIIKGAQRMLSEFGYSLIVEWCDAGLESEREIIQKMISQDVDGFLIYPFDPVASAPNYDLIGCKGIPYVLIDRYNPNSTTYYAGCNNYGGAIAATSELIRLKHTKIKFAGYHFFLSSEQERFDGYCSAMRRAGLPIPQDCLLNPIDHDVLAESILKHDITAIFCSNDKLAVSLIQKLTKKGVQVPEDVSVFGFDDWDILRRNKVGIATVKQNFEEIGSHAANLLVNAAQGKFTDNSTTILTGVELVIRESICENKWY